MRAGRLLTIMLTLADEGRTTTSALSTRLEVSRRTILRDLEALGGAGVPVVTYAGPGGGVQLLDGWRPPVRGLPGAPGLGLLMGGQPLLARALGMPDGLVGEGWLVIDPDAAAGHAVDPALLRDAARACRDGLGLVITVDGARHTVRPLRLVLRAGRWLLVTGGEGDAPEEVALDRVDGHERRGATLRAVPPSSPRGRPAGH